jgi:YfiH family protein
MHKNGFMLRKFHDVPYYSCREFESLPHLRHGFSTRHGGVSPTGASASGASASGGPYLNLSDTPWDSPDRVQENRRRFLSALDLENARLITLRQIHSDRVHIIEDNFGRWNQSKGDALCTRVENVALAVQIADCVPVLIADPAHNAVAAVHSGWRGTLARVLPKTIQEMKLRFGSDPASLLIALGPGIRACCFEIGLEVADPFENQYPGCRLTRPLPGRPEKHSLDLFKALEVQMNLEGVRPENRFDLGVCTCCNTGEFFSHRAEGPDAGRMMAVIGLKFRGYGDCHRNL